MAHHQDLYWEAYRAYEGGRYAEAALQFRAAAAAARQAGDAVWRHRALVWAASAETMRAAYKAALALLFEARLDQPPDAAPQHVWIAGTLRFEIMRLTAPRRAALAESLAELEAQRTPDRAADLALLAGMIALLRGEWAAARSHCEAGWRDYRKGVGYAHFTHASWAAEACMRLGALDAVADWIAAIGQSQDDRQASAADIRHHQTWRRAQLLLAEGATAETAAAARDACVAAESNFLDIEVRLHLLQPAWGDPSDPAHPARRALTRRTALSQSVHHRYDRRLVVADYRLACLRAALGVAPVDDLFYRQPQAAPSRRPPADLLTRLLRQARAAAAVALRTARWIDEMAECDWRTKEVTARFARIDALVAALPQGGASSQS